MSVSHCIEPALNISMKHEHICQRLVALGNPGRYFVSMLPAKSGLAGSLDPRSLKIQAQYKSNNHLTGGSASGPGPRMHCK